MAGSRPEGASSITASATLRVKEALRRLPTSTAIFFVVFIAVPFACPRRAGGIVRGASGYEQNSLLVACLPRGVLAPLGPRLRSRNPVRRGRSVFPRAGKRSRQGRARSRGRREHLRPLRSSRRQLDLPARQCPAHR